MFPSNCTGTCGRAVHVIVQYLRQGSPSTVQLRSVLPLGPGPGEPGGARADWGSLPAVVEVVLVGDGHQLGLGEVGSVSERQEGTHHWLGLLG